MKLNGAGEGVCDVALVIADGLSSAAVHGHALAMVRELLPRWSDAKLTIGPAVIARGARVALGDEIGALVKARLVVMLIGERPGLSAPDSLGCYITYAPRLGLSDADRNCVSNIHAAGLTYREAASKIAWLVTEAFARHITGVQLKDESTGQPRPRAALKVLRAMRGKRCRYFRELAARFTFNACDAGLPRRL